MFAGAKISVIFDIAMKGREASQRKTESGNGFRFVFLHNFT
jgi:hypothetical protein